MRRSESGQEQGFVGSKSAAPRLASPRLSDGFALWFGGSLLAAGIAWLLRDKLWVSVLGGLLSLSLTLVIWLLLLNRQRARVLAFEHQRLASIVEGTSAGSWEWNFQTGENRYNERWAEMIGHTLDELRPLSQQVWREHVHPADLPRIMQSVQRHIDGLTPRYECEYRMRHRDGHWVWVSSRGKLFSRTADGKPLWLAGAQLDVTERRRAEAEIQRSERLLRGAMEAIDEGFVLFDPEDRLVFCNEKYREVYADVDDLLVPGTPFETLVRAHVERAPDHHEARGREEAWIAERMAQHRSGDAKMVLRVADGRAMRIIERQMPDGHTVGFRIDITDLMRATEAAEKAAQAKGQFLANTSHEIRTPMNAVLGMLKLLQKTALSPRQQDYVAKTEGAARSLLGLLNDILDFSKAEAGKMSLDLQALRIDELLRDLAVILSASLGRRDIELLFDVDPALPPAVVADRLRLQQVLVNLAGNAIKFTEVGEVVVQLRLIELAGEEVTIDFAVTDTGIGIAPEHQGRIFAGFTQAEASTTRRFGGTGLGLAISQRLVQLMGADLQLESVLGQGSRFSFRLRLALPEGQVLPKTPEPGPAPLRALLVDDNAAARELLGGMAESLGWQVDMADSGEAALRRMSETVATGQDYQVVLVDWAMPGMDGWDTSRALRALTHDRGTPPLLVMVTAHGREVLAQRGEQEQELLDGFLVKPVTASMLQDAITDARMAAARGRSTLARADAEPQLRRLAGLRLLLVEDNANNQQIARELLEDEGAIVQLAGDGQQALSQLAQSKGGGRRIDAVLMDVQMPVMDGYTATRLIRRQLGMTLPIVAMTANAQSADRQACLDVGMSEHVGKPFDIDHLVGVLARHCGLLVGPGGLPALAPRAGPPLPQPLLERAQKDGIELGEALGRLSGKAELFARTVTALAEAAVALPRPLTSAALHGLRGLAGTLGARALAGLAGEGERALQAGEPLPEGWQARFDLALPRTLAALHELVRLLPRPADGWPTHVELAPDLGSLIELLDGSDMAALDAYARLRPTLVAERAPVAEQLEAAIGTLDFASAAGHCRALLRELEPL